LLVLVSLSISTMVVCVFTTFRLLVLFVATHGVYVLVLLVLIINKLGIFVMIER